MPEPPPPRKGPRQEPEHVYERSADPAEAANRPLEPKSRPHELAERDEPGEGPGGPRPDPPHHSLNTPIGEPDPAADSDPYQPQGPDEESDTASGTSGVHQGIEERRRER